MQTARGGNNAQSVFGIQEIPSDNQIRGMLDPDSHPTLYRWVNLLQGPELGTLKIRVKSGSQWHTYAYRWANQVPLAEGEGTLPVNWCELTLTDPQGQVLYHNAWITDWPLTENNVAAVVDSGRASAW